MFGPAPRRLPALPLAIADGSLTVAAAFVGKVGAQQTRVMGRGRIGSVPKMNAPPSGMKKNREMASMTRKQWLLSGCVRVHKPYLNRCCRRSDRKLQPGDASPSENPEPGNWMLYRRTYDGQGYSPLDQINTSNVKNLTPVWTFSTGVVEGHEAPPIVNNGVMFVTTPMGQVIALNAKTGDEYWRYKRSFQKICFSCIRPTAASACGRTSSISPRPMIMWSRSTPRPARWSGTPRSRTTRRVST